MRNKTLIVITGPTAVGKTAFAVELAKQFDIQIVSADSRQCYKELNIGVAKPSQQELETVEHYFINSHSIFDTVNAGVYEQYALEKINQIFQTNDFAIVVGGTGLYINALCNGIDAIPETPIEIRNKIIEHYNQLGLQWLQTEVKQQDELFWNTCEQNNPQRLMRALEVVMHTGKSINTFKSNRRVERAFNIVKYGLHLDRPSLYNRINCRVDAMMQEGLLNEVNALIEYRHLNALQTVGYSELFAYFNNECSLDSAIEKIKQNTRNYAKRQVTWFKRDAELKWLNIFENTNAIAQVVNCLK